MIFSNEIKKLIIPVMIIFLASCQGNTDREWRVSNESSDTVHVQASLVFIADTIYDTVVPGDINIITITNEEKGNSLPQQAYDVFSYFMISSDEGDPIRKNFLDNDNWDIYIDQTKSNPQHFEQTYTMIVTDKDLQ